MNLLPAEARQSRTPGERAGAPGRVRIFWRTLPIALTLAMIGLDVNVLRTRLEGARSDRDRLGTLIGEREGLEERLVADRERLRQLRVAEGRLARWDEERFLLPELLRGLSVAIPDAVVLEEIRREGPDFRVTGRGDSASVVARAVDALSGMERVRDLELLWVERVDGAAGLEEQRFALAGALRFASREPQPFETVETAPRDRERYR